MHCIPEMLISPEKQQQTRRGQRQNQFFKDRVTAKKKSPDVIVVEFSFDDNGFDILSWAINMAARPGDHIVALRLRTLDTMHRFKAGQTYKPEAIDAHFKPLRDLCDLRQVQLEVRLAVNETVEKLLVAEAFALRATILVVSASGHNALRHAQKRGSFLARNVPAQCAVVVVKDYKVLFYKDDSSSGSASKNCSLSDEGIQFTTSRQINQGLEKQFGYLEDQLSGITVREIDNYCALDTTIISCNKIWPDSTGAGSPRRIFEGPVISSESDDSPTSSLYSGLPRSLSRKAFPLRTYSHGDDASFYKKKTHNWLGIHKVGSIPRLQIFPSVHLFRKICNSFPCRTLGNSLKSYINSFWGMMVIKRSGTDKTSILSERSESTNGWKNFTYEEILKATDFFSPGNMVGKGGHAEVYKGSLPGGQLVAVKRLIRGDTEEQKIRDFLTELGIVCHISHPNATPLVGFCIEKGLYLIFHFSQQGSLATWLYGSKLPPLRWGARYKVAVGTACGLNYLHTGCQRRIIHRDIKASNILLGPDFEPQISDFGLAKWLPDQCSHHILTPIEGTFGYLAPEYFMHGIVDEKTDVFAFGVLLLELITGRKPIESSQPSLVMWARSFLENMNFEELADARLNGAYDPQEMQCMVMAAGLCVQQSPILRPRMNQVLQLLTDQPNSDTAHSWSMVSSQSFFQDSLFDGDYSCINYHNDMRRHREVALQF